MAAGITNVGLLYGGRIGYITDGVFRTDAEVDEYLNAYDVQFEFRESAALNTRMSMVMVRLPRATRLTSEATFRFSGWFEFFRLL